MARSLQALHGLKVLHVTSLVSHENWLGKAFGEMPQIRMDLREVHGSFEGMRALQTEAFDVVLVSIRPMSSSLDFIDGCRTSGVTAPMLILGRRKDANLLTQCFERGGDGVITLEGTTVSDLLWQIFQAWKNQKNEMQNAELRSRLQQESIRKAEENQQFIAQHRALLAEDSGAGYSSEWDAQYLELLKTCIPLSLSRHTQLIRDFTQKLIQEKISAADLFAMHTNALETILKSPGRKSSLHLMNRANLVLNQMMLALLNHCRKMQELAEKNCISFDDFASQS